MHHGLRILRRRRAVDLALARQFMDVPVANVSDCMARMTAGGARMRPMHAGGRMAGPALTVKTRPGDNLMIHAALAIAQPGDVIIVDGKADQTCALIGEIMTSQAAAIGVAGYVIDAAVRDVEALRAMNFPVFSYGYNPAGPTKRIPGRVNHPISIGGITVNPGDLVVGDADGVVVIPQAFVGSLLPLAATKVADERKRLDDIASGRALRPKWLEASLRAAGVLGEGQTI